MARFLARIYHSLGVLPSPKVTEVSRGDLIGQYVGSTALKVREVFQRALGGVLFIDEAYGLTEQHGTPWDFGAEAVTELVKLMEDHRGEIAVVVAGYNREMEEFFQSNTGLASRFPHRIHFDDYTSNELVEIFEGLCAENDYLLSSEAKAALCAMFEIRVSGLGADQSDGNGRYARNVFEGAIRNAAVRVLKTGRLDDQSLKEIKPEDLDVDWSQG